MFGKGSVAILAQGNQQVLTCLSNFELLSITSIEENVLARFDSLLVSDVGRCCHTDTEERARGRTGSGSAKGNGSGSGSGSGPGSGNGSWNLDV